MIKTSQFLLFLVLLFFITTVTSVANNLSISSVTTTGQDVSAGVDNAANFIFVDFDISWENSFRDAVNWDAAWVFIKYKTSDGVWHHGTLNTTGHTAPTGSTIDTPSDGMGVFIYRDATGTGTFSLSNVQLRWNYGTNGVADNETVTVKVFSIEMVEVPTGSFVIGDGDGTNESTNSFHSGTTNSSVTIDASLTNDIRVDVNSSDDDQIENPGIGIDGDGGLDTDNDGNIDNANFPTGYNAFYCMKYELTQGQYVDFLNTLTRDQQDTRTYTWLASGTTSVSWRYVMIGNTVVAYKNGIRCDATIHTSDPITFYNDLDGDGTGNESVDGENIACNYIMAADLMAYADWAGLRPMSELEFEKACRGAGQASLLSEFAWGTKNISSADYAISNSGAANEEVSSNYSTTSGNAKFQVNSGNSSFPVRVGIFAANAGNTGRETSGASYYGIMELSGNLAENCVTVGESFGRIFEANHGDGALSTSGDMNVTSWPSNTGNASGRRGSSFLDSHGYGRVSNRTNALVSFSQRREERGGRLVRTK